MIAMLVVGTHLLHLDKLVDFNGFCFQPPNTSPGMEPQTSATSVTTELAHHFFKKEFFLM